MGSMHEPGDIPGRVGFKLVSDVGIQALWTCLWARSSTAYANACFPSELISTKVARAQYLSRGALHDAV